MKKTNIFDHSDDYSYEYCDEYGLPTYGTSKSSLLKDVLEAGFKPVGITVMMCEETFIFRGKKEAEDAWEKFKPEGWWYDYSSFVDARRDYVKRNYNGDPTQAAQIYWLDKNFELNNVDDDKL